MQLKLLTLNCWGIPFGISNSVSQRFEAIAEKLVESNYDIVSLQEVWQRQEYEKLVSRCKSVYPYYTYFRSGMIGAGICVFSRYKISDCFFSSFTLGGIPYMIHHGDWYAGKGFGICKVTLPDGITALVISTHTHAEYSTDNSRSTYVWLRMWQLYELASLTRQMGSSCDITLLMGDINMRPDQLGARLLRSYGGFHEAIDLPDESDISLSTCDRADNRFTSKGIESVLPLGQRIDVVYFNAATHTAVERVSFMVRPWGAHIEGTDLPYSDHEPLEVVLDVKLTTSKEIPKDDIANRDLIETAGVFKEGVQALYRYQYHYSIIMFLLSVLLIFINYCEIPFSLVLLMNAVIIVTLLIFSWHVLLDYPLQANTLRGAIDNINTHCSIHIK